MSCSTLVQCRPEPGIGLTFNTGNAAALEAFNNVQANFTAYRDVFGMLLGKPRSNLCSSATTTESFLCNMDLAAAYKTREVLVLSEMVDAAIINSRNNFLTGLAPILETPEIYFTINKRNISAMPFTKIAPCGIAEEPSGSSTSYSFTQTVEQFEQSCTINRDLALDENFGARFWLEKLGEFVTNARLTINMGIITTLVQMGYENMSRSMIEGVPIDVNKLFYATHDAFLIAAVDPELFIDHVRRQEETIPELDTLIIPAGKTSYLTRVAGDSMTMLTQKISTDPVTAEVIADLATGPTSFKTIRLGDRGLDIIEFQPFFLGDKVPMRINPLLARVVVGQFYPPNPFINPESCAGEKLLCGETTDTRIFQQTKKIGLEQPISLADRLRNSNYWDPVTGKPSRLALEYTRLQTQRRRQPGMEPYSWNASINTRYNNRKDVNIDLSSNSEPNMEEVANKSDLKEMRSFRDEFVGQLYNPKTNEYGVPKRFGDFHLSAIPNAYFKMNAGILEAKFEKVYGHSVEEGFTQLHQLGDALRNAAWTDSYLFALLDKNIPRMIAFNAAVNAPSPFTIQTVRTPLNREERNQCKFPEAEIIEEAKGNRFGGWDLPDKPADLLQEYPAGFASGVGILTLAQETLRTGESLWTTAGEEAMKAVLFAQNLLTFIKDYIGKTDLINRKLMGPWFHESSEVAALIDSIIGTTGPAFIGIPATINASTLPVMAPVAQVDIAPDSLLGATVEDTNRTLRAAVTNNLPRIPVNNKTRALACLYNPVYEKVLNLDLLVDALGSSDHFRAEMIKLVHQLYDYVIALCDSTENQAQRKNAVQIASILMESFYDKLNSYVAPLDLIVDEEGKENYRLNTILKEMRSYSIYFTRDSAMKKFLNTEKARREKASGPECIDYGEGFIEALKAYERPVSEAGQPITVVEGGGAVPLIPAAPVYRADYTVAPTKYIRAPIVTSATLRDYLRDKALSWILPGDSRLFYSRPEDVRIASNNPALCLNPHKNQLEICSLSRRLIFECRLNSKKTQNIQDDDLFASLRSVKSKSKENLQARTTAPLNMGQFLSMGQFRSEDGCSMMEDPYYKGAIKADEKVRYPYVTPSGEVDLSRAMEEEEYTGPWRARLAYMHKNVNRLGQRFFFRAQLEAPNNLETPVKLANIGGILLDAIIVRPFIELRTSAALAMKRGKDTMITTIGHSHVQVTKEKRGCWHLSVGFMMGLVKIRPENVVLIPHAFPESLIGGKDINWMTDFKNMSLPNPTRESMISILVGADERKFDGPIHIANGPTAFRPDIDYAYHLRKHSGGRWMEFIMGPNVVANIDIANLNRETYATCLRSSNILTQGPASYIDPKTGVKRDVEGNGAMGSFIMNMPGVQEVYEGRAKRFPDRQQMYVFQNTL